MNSQIFDDVGFLGDTHAVRQILEGTFVFPSDTDPFTKLLLEDAHNVYSAMGKGAIGVCHDRGFSVFLAETR